MFFATYIQKLHYYIEPTTKRSEFTEKILKMIVINEKLIDYTDSSYNGFFDGKTQGRGNDKKIIGDKICNCAKKIVGSLDESEDKNKPLPKFKAYLENLQFNNATKEKLCDSFRCELPNINVDNYIDELSKLLIKIIKVAAGKESKEENTIPSIEDITSVEGKNIEHLDDECSGITLSCLTRINDGIMDLIGLIDILLQKGESLAKEVNRNSISTPYRKCSNWESFQKFYNQYQEKNIALHTYFEKYNCNIFTPAIKFKDKFTSDSFWRCNPMRYTMKLDTKNKIQEYRGILLEISKELEKRLS